MPRFLPHSPGEENRRALAALHRIAAYAATLSPPRFRRRIVAAASASSAASAGAIAPPAFVVILHMPFFVRDSRPVVDALSHYSTRDYIGGVRTLSSSYSRFGGNGHDDDNDDHGIVVPSRCRLSSARRSSNDDDDDDAHRRGVGHASTSIETFFPPSCISDMRLILASNKDLDAFVGIAGSVGRMERANDDAAYDESRSIDAVAGDGGMRRNTPGASEERTDARGRAARMSSTQQSTNDKRC